MSCRPDKIHKVVKDFLDLWGGIWFWGMGRIGRVGKVSGDRAWEFGYWTRGRACLNGMMEGSVEDGDSGKDGGDG